MQAYKCNNNHRLAIATCTAPFLLPELTLPTRDAVNFDVEVVATPVPNVP
jgi:hypothetical protein